MAIVVKNKSTYECKVAINRWGTGGSTDYYKITPGGEESWDRTDKRGFVMSVEHGSTTLQYFVLKGSEVDIFDGEVKINDKIANHL